MQYITVLSLLMICPVVYAGGYRNYLQTKSDSSLKPGGLIIITGNQPVPKYLLNGPFTVLPGLSERLFQGKISRLDIADSLASLGVKSDGYVARATGKSVAFIAPSSKPNRRLKKRRFRQRNPELQNRRNSKRVESKDSAEFNLQRKVESFQPRRNESIRLSKVVNSAYTGFSLEEGTLSKEVPSKTNARLDLVPVKIPSGKSFPPPTVTIKGLPPKKKYTSIPVPTRKTVPTEVPNLSILKKNSDSTSNLSIRADFGKKPNTEVFPNNNVYPGSVYKSKPTPGYSFPVPALVDNFQPVDLPKDIQYPVDTGYRPEVYSPKQDLVTTPTSPTKSSRRVFKTPVSKGIVYSQPDYPSTIPTSVIVKPYKLPELPIDKVFSFNQNYLPNPTKPVLVSKVYQSKNINSKSDAFAKADPYSFGYGVYDGLGTSQYRQESSSGDGKVIGNYGYQDFQGLFRQVEYVADDSGFHAVLKSNEPGLGSAAPADVSLILENPPPSLLINS